MKIKSIDKSSLITIRNAINKRLADMEKEFGVRATVGNIRYTDRTCTIKVECALTDGLKPGEDPIYSDDFKRNCILFNMDESYLGKVFKNDNGTPFKILGSKSSSRKYPIIAESLISGKQFKFAPSFVKSRISDNG